MNDVDLERTLEARAVALSAPSVETAADDLVEILILRVGGGRFGLPLAEAEAVISEIAVTPLPHLPAPWSGVVHLRGRLVAVADLGQLVGESPTEVRYVVVLSLDDTCALGLDSPPLVDRIRPEDMAVTPRDTAAIAGCLRGATPDGIALLDSQDLLKLLASDTRRRHQERI